VLKQSLDAVSALGPLVIPADHRSAVGGSDVVIRERSGVALCSVLARRGRKAELEQRVHDKLGVELPQVQKYSASSSLGIASAGPGHWLIMSDQAKSTQFELQLRTELAGLASVFDQSDGRTIVQVSGPRARDALAKGVLIDLHPGVFGAGSAAVTSIAYIGVHFWQTDEKPTYEFAMFRSFAMSFCDWLLDSSAEFGVALSLDRRLPLERGDELGR
jgi:heterotetrameric sarcosine oxidase gamma subunit